MLFRGLQAGAGELTGEGDQELRVAKDPGRSDVNDQSLHLHVRLLQRCQQQQQQQQRQQQQQPQQQ